MRNFRDFGICLSLANLCFLDAWSSLQGPIYSFFSKDPAPLRGYFAITLINIFLTSLLLWMGVWGVRRSGPRIKAFAAWILMVVILLPLNIFRSQFPSLGYANLAGKIGAYIFPLLAAIVVIAGGALLVLGPRRIAAGICTASLILLPLLPIEIGWTLRSAFPATARGAYEDKPLATPLVSPKTATRIVWLMFDEMDEQLAFVDRPTDVSLPALDRFRQESLYATDARPSNNFTYSAIPALFTGKWLTSVEARGPDELKLVLADGKNLWLTETANVFARLREKGVNSGVAGWYLPYCRLFDSVLAACSWESASYAISRDLQLSAVDQSFAKRLWAQWRKRLLAYPLALRLLSRFHNLENLNDDPFVTTEGEFSLRDGHRRAFLEIRRQAAALLLRQDLQFLFLHFPIPHPPGIYSIRDNRLSADPSGDYLDSLVLADQTFDEMRHLLESARLWESTVVLLTSDHPFRPAEWRKRPSSISNRMQAALDHAGMGSLNRIPFLLKLAGQKEALPYRNPFSTLLASDLIAAIFQGELPRPSDVAAWLDSNRGLYSLQPSPF